MNKYEDVIIADEATFTSDLQVQMQAFGLPVTVQQCHDFYRYYVALIETNKVMNLTGIVDMHEVIVKHLVDSLSCYNLKYLKDGISILDVGTGAGFPGIPLAIYNRTLQVTLFDSLMKRLKFLQAVIDELGLENARILHGRAEDIAHQVDYREAYDMVTTRAVARLAVLSEWTLPYIKQGGYLVALKGAAFEEEVNESLNAFKVLGGQLVESSPVKLPGLDDKRAVLYIQKTKATPKKYPRKPKEIKDKAL